MLNFILTAFSMEVTHGAYRLVNKVLCLDDNGHTFFPNEEMYQE